MSQVNGLVDRFFQARTMMNQMASGGGMPGMPGMPGVPGAMGGGKRAKARQQAKKGRAKRGSGNPAKRAQQQKAAAQPPAVTGSPFGDPDGPAAPTPSTADFKLPKDLRDRL